MPPKLALALMILGWGALFVSIGNALTTGQLDWVGPGAIAALLATVIVGVAGAPKPRQ